MFITMMMKKINKVVANFITIMESSRMMENLSAVYWNIFYFAVVSLLYDVCKYSARLLAKIKNIPGIWAILFLALNYITIINIYIYFFIKTVVGLSNISHFSVFQLICLEILKKCWPCSDQYPFQFINKLAPNNMPYVFLS